MRLTAHDWLMAQTTATDLRAAGFRRLADIPGVSHLPPFFGFCAAEKSYEWQDYHRAPQGGIVVICRNCCALDPQDARRLGEVRV